MTTVDRFGVEVECHGITRRAAAEAIRSVVGGEVRYLGGTYDTWACIGPDGRKWQAMRDSSIRAIGDYQVEVVTPILTRADMENFQAVIRAVKGAGAKVDDSCGIHVHIDGARASPWPPRGTARPPQRRRKPRTTSPAATKASTSTAGFSAAPSNSAGLRPPSTRAKSAPTSSWLWRWATPR